MRDLQKAFERPAKNSFDSSPLGAEELVGCSVGSLSRATGQWSGYMAHVHRKTMKNAQEQGHNCPHRHDFLKV